MLEARIIWLACENHTRMDAGSSVMFPLSFTGSTNKIPIYAREKVIVPAYSSSAVMQASFKSLQDVGSVEVTRGSLGK